jgi:hypothetical protein
VKPNGDSTVEAMDSGGPPPGDTGTIPPGTDAPTSDTGTVVNEDTGPGPGTDSAVAACSQITGACDIVSQNCGANMECVSGIGPDGGNATQCSADQPSEHLDKGHACCPSTSGMNPCDPGLECIGNPCSADAAAPQTGRCSPHCCLGPDGGDNTPCGVSDPEGYPGRCDLQIVDNSGNPLYAVCDYSTNCKPLGVQPCASGYVCLVQDNSGTATCAAVFLPDGGNVGLPVGQPCIAGNECVEGAMCLGPGGDAASTCTLLCYVPGGSPPFDAGLVADGGPGHGGCLSGQSCQAVQASLFPPWLGICQ